MNTIRIASVWMTIKTAQLLLKSIYKQHCLVEHTKLMNGKWHIAAMDKFSGWQPHSIVPISKVSANYRQDKKGLVSKTWVLTFANSTGSFRQHKPGYYGKLYKTQ